MNSLMSLDRWRFHFPLVQPPAVEESVKAPETVTQLLPAGAEFMVAVGDTVTTGEPLCRIPRYGSFASISGTVKRILPWDGGPRGRFCAVIITRGPDQEHYRLFDPMKEATALSSEQLRGRCAMAGFHFPDDQGPILFIALDEDIDRITNRWAVEKEFDRVVSGLKMLRHLYGNRKIVIALPTSMPVERKRICAAFGDTVAVPERYPDTAGELIVRRHPVLKSSGRVAVIDSKRLLALVTSLSTGKAVTAMLVSVRSGRKGPVRLFRVPIGMRIADLLSACDVRVSDGMQLVLGGEMTGAAVDSADQPLMPESDSLLILPPHEVVLGENTPCVNCGRCHRVCPANLRVDLIGKCVEFSRSSEAVRLGIDRCIDCGLCTAACIVRRPLAHLLAFGKGAFARERRDGEGAA